MTSTILYTATWEGRLNANSCFESFIYGDGGSLEIVTEIHFWLQHVD